MGYLSDFDAWYEQRMAEMQKKLKAVMDDAAERYIEIVYRRAQEECAMAIQAFYTDYRPRKYSRKYGLYNIMDISEHGDVLSVGFDPSKMTPYRSGYTGEDGLYETVFREGWHGGAKYGPGHPAPGTAYWRAGRNYNRWGRRATISTPAPLDDFKQRIQEYANTVAHQDYEQVFLACAKEHGLS